MRKTVFGSASKCEMRVSGSAHGDGGRAGSGVQLVRPVAPVVSSLRSETSSTGEIWCRRAAENELPSNGGAATAGAFRNCVSVTARGGALPASGVGRNGAYGALPGATSVSVLTKYVTGLMV